MSSRILAKWSVVLSRALWLIYFRAACLRFRDVCVCVCAGGGRWKRGRDWLSTHIIDKSGNGPASLSVRKLNPDRFKTRPKWTHSHTASLSIPLPFSLSSSLSLFSFLIPINNSPLDKLANWRRSRAWTVNETVERFCRHCLRFALGFGYGFRISGFSSNFGMQVGEFYWELLWH